MVILLRKIFLRKATHDSNSYGDMHNFKAQIQGDLLASVLIQCNFDYINACSAWFRGPQKNYH